MSYESKRRVASRSSGRIIHNTNIGWGFIGVGRLNVDWLEGWVGKCGSVLLCWLEMNLG